MTSNVLLSYYSMGKLLSFVFFVSKTHNEVFVQ